MGCHMQVLTKVIFAMLSLIWLTAASMYQPFYAFIGQMTVCSYGVYLCKKHSLSSFCLAFAVIAALDIVCVMLLQSHTSIVPLWVLNILSNLYQE